MNRNDLLSSLSKGELISLIEAYSKNWLAMDGVWFQSVERKFGMDEAMYHDCEAWKVYTVTEARRIKAFLGLPERPGLEGLAKALQLRFYAHINKQDFVFVEDGRTLTYHMVDCFVQTARKRKGMEFHPCKSVGVIEYSGFARTIDDRIACQCISCYPEMTDESCCCAWKFTLNE